MKTPVGDSRRLQPKFAGMQSAGNIVLGLVIALVLGSSGCRSDARFVQRSQTRSATPVSRADDSRKSPAPTADNAASDSSATTKLAKSAPPEKPRKFFPDLFRKNRDPQTVPLPTTPISEDLPVTASPVEDFQ